MSRSDFPNLSKGWRLTPLKHLVSSSGGMTPSKDRADFWDGTVPWVSPKDMKQPLLEDSIDHVTELAVASTGLKLHAVDSVMVVTRGMILAHTFPVARNTVPVTVNQDMKVLRARPGVDARYLAWMLKGLESLMLSLTDESAHGTKALRTDQWENLRVPMPSPASQERIANFLDEQTARIDALIAQKESLQVLLHEEQQSCIDRAVLGGVDTVKDFPFMPPTQVIQGQVWARCMLKQRWTVTDCKHLTVEFVDSGVPLASIREVNGNNLDLARAKMCSVQDYENLVQGRRQPQFGDLIYARNASVGAVALVDVDRCFAMGQDVCLITSIHDDQKFLRFQLLSSPLKAQLESLLQGATIRRINVEQIRSFALFVPPPEIQRNVVAKIEEELGVRAALQAHCKEHITRLREYRSSLISAAVTGQLNITWYQEAA